MRTYTQRWALQASGSGSGPMPSYSNPSTTAVTYSSLTVARNALTTWTASVPVIVPYTFTVCNAADTTAVCNSKCAAQGASNNGGTCYAYLKFTGLCLVVNSAGNGADSSGAGTGCAVVDSRIRSSSIETLISAVNDLSPYDYA